MIYRFHRKPPISQGMTAQPKNLHISGKHVGQLFVGKMYKCNLGMLKDSMMGYFLVMFFCRYSFFTGTVALYVETWAVTSYDVLPYVLSL